MAAALVCLAVLGPATAAERVAKVEQVKGFVQATGPDGQARKLARGDPVYAGDSVRTSPRGRIRLLFTDETRFELSGATELIVEDYLLDSQGEASTFRTRIIKGAFRFLTGLIAKRRPQAVQVQLSVAAIGIRGTQVVGEVEETSARVILLEPEDEQRATAIEVSNAFGSVVIDEPGFGTEIPDEHSPPSPPRRMRLQTINNLMRMFQQLQRMRLP